MEHNRGPSMEPYGTPREISWRDDIVSLIGTNLLRLVR